MTESNSVDSLDTQTMVIDIENKRKQLKYWMDNEFDAIIECDQLRQDLIYFETKLDQIKEPNDFVQI